VISSELWRSEAVRGEVKIAHTILARQPHSLWKLRDASPFCLFSCLTTLSLGARHTIGGRGLDYSGYVMECDAVYYVEIRESFEGIYSIHLQD
jgi:hypothetical protein